ncbi:hypothetical protein PIB30_062401 [Stylosanthes scabra]|uniref:Multidrug and toxic compound extrusion protein n=1 Tax=Stylosanthes scabra TaxID=79078 RepID=A0ABU6QLH4_9FABA|nr:hypothetical protein [Stylosanthes scabra]
MMKSYSEGSNNGSSSGELSSKVGGDGGGDVNISKGETPLYLGSSSLEAAELHHAPDGLVETNLGDYDHGINGSKDFIHVFILESIKLWAIAGPIAFNILCNYAVNSFTNIFVGHIGDLELSAVAISLSVISNLSFGFLLGMASALETLCGQAYGAGQVEMLGVYMQRSWIILLGACILLLPIYIYSEPILILLGQDHEIAELAGTFTIQSIPQMFSLAINFPTQKFLQAQSRVGILAWLGFASLVVHICILEIFIKLLGWGTAGHPKAAKYSVIVTVTQSLFIGIVSAVIILAAKDHIAVIFTDSLEMQRAVSKLASLLGITMLLNSVQPVISGVAVGGGWQALVAYINLFCYYIVGLPLGFLLGYKMGLRVQGIWIGMICGTVLQTLILLHIIYNTNWNREVEEASKRMRKWTGQDMELHSMS